MTPLKHKEDSFKNMKRKTSIRFCSYCGGKIVGRFISAYTPKEQIGRYTLYYGSIYDKKTGKKQFVQRFICSSWEEKNLFGKESPHDSYIENQILIF